MAAVCYCDSSTLDVSHCLLCLAASWRSLITIKMSAMDGDGEDEVQQVSLNMEMSRGLKAEYQLQWHLVEDMEVFDEFGKRVRFGDLYKKQKAIIIFVRVSLV